MSRRRVGWYRLPRSRALFHGTIPDGIDEAPAPDAPAPAPVDLERPASDARKADLIAYVDALNLDGDGIPSTRNRTKAELWALINGGDEIVDTPDSGAQVGADVLIDEGITDDQQVIDTDEPAGNPDTEPVQIGVTQGDQG